MSIDNWWADKALGSKCRDHSYCGVGRWAMGLEMAELIAAEVRGASGSLGHGEEGRGSQSFSSLALPFISFPYRSYVLLWYSRTGLHPREEDGTRRRSVWDGRAAAAIGERKGSCLFAIFYSGVEISACISPGDNSILGPGLACYGHGQRRFLGAVKGFAPRRISHVPDSQWKRENFLLMVDQ